MKYLSLIILFFLSFSIYSQNRESHRSRIKHERIQYHIVVKKFVSDYVKLDSVQIDTNIFMRTILDLNLIEDFKTGKLKTSDLNYVVEMAKIIPPKSSYQNDEKIKFEQPQPQVINRTNNILYDEILPPIGKADLTYVIQDTMTINIPYTVDVTLSKDMNQKQLIKIIDSYKNKELIDTLIDISPVMSAKLVDPTGKNFTVTPVTEETQNTTDKNLIRWQWQVVPLTEGENYLTINVNNIIGGVPQSVNIYNGKTYVYAKHTMLGDLWIWIKTNWTYITYVIGGLCAIFVFLYKEKIINIFKRKE